MLKKTLILLAVLLSSTSLFAQGPPPFPRGHVFFAADFEARDALKGWSGPAVLGKGSQGGHALVLTSSTGQGGDAVARRQLPVEAMRGYVVQFSARIKAENVSRKPLPYNGVKFMAAIATDHEKTWPAAELAVGTFDWQKVVFRTAIPENAREVSLVVGLEAVSGTACFDDIRVSAWKPPPGDGPHVTTGKIYKGHDLPRLRGAMVGADIDEEGLRVFGREWNANLIRWQLVRLEKFDDPLDLAAYDRWLQSALQKLMQRDPLLAKVLPRRPGTKESRYAHLLAGDVVEAEMPVYASTAGERNPADAERIARLEGEVAELRREVGEVKDQWERFRRQFE